ncbi:hypothetical protein ACPA9J_31510 [Pseudomonas aeruginosa]
MVAAYPALRSSFDPQRCIRTAATGHTQARSEPLILDLPRQPEAGTVLDEHPPTPLPSLFAATAWAVPVPPRSSARTPGPGVQLPPCDPRRLERGQP